MATEASHQVSRIQHRVSRIQNPASSIESFMQNKPNLLNTKMDVSSVTIKNYEDFRPFCPRKNKPNSNPNKPNYKKAEMNVSAVITKQYEDYRLPALTKNKPKQTQSNPIIRFLPGLRCKRRRGVESLFPSRANKYNVGMTAQRDKYRIETIREKIKTFPTGPGLYFMKAGGDTVLYIGKAKNLRSR